MEQTKDHSVLVDRDNYPEVIPEVLPEVYQEAPEVYKEAPEVYYDGVPPERHPDIHSTHPRSVRQRWWKRHRRWAFVCIPIIIVVIVGGAVGGSVAATDHKNKTRTKPTPTSATMTAAIQTAYSFPTVISPLPGRKTIFGTTAGTNGLSKTMWYKSSRNGTWDLNFTTIGLPLNPNSWANVGVTRRVTGILDTFAVGTDRSCVQKHWNGTSTIDIVSPLGTDYILQAGDFSSSVEPMSAFSTRIDLFGLTEAKRLMQLVWINGKETSWTEVAGQNTSTSWLFAPAVIVATPNRGDVFVVDAKTLQVNQMAWIDNGVNPMLSQNIGGSCTSRPCAISRSDGSIDLFCRDANALLSWSSLPSLNGTWTAWKPVLGSPVISNEPHAISRIVGTMQLFVQTANDSIAFGFFDGHMWLWTDLGGTFAGPPKAVSENPLDIEVFAYGKDGALKRNYWKKSTNASVQLQWWPMDTWEDLGTP